MSNHILPIAERVATQILRERIEGLSTETIQQFLWDTGWREYDKLDTRAIYLKKGKYKMLFPLDRTVSDYYSRMYDVFRVLEVVENELKEVIITDFFRQEKALSEIGQLKICCNSNINLANNPNANHT